jgi:hypothetical protein
MLMAEWKPSKVPSNLCIEKRNHPSPPDWEQHVDEIAQSAEIVKEVCLTRGAMLSILHPKMHAGA